MAEPKKPGDSPLAKGAILRGDFEPPEPDARDRLGFQAGARVHISPEQIAALPEPIQAYIQMLVRENESLRKTATTDLLTNAHNRRAFEERMQEHFETLRRHQVDKERGKDKRSLPDTTIVSFDLDGFKGINDSLGHGAGDEALKHVVRFFTSRLRGNDFFARLGGDEFVIIAHGPEENIKSMMENLRTEFVDEGFSYTNGQTSANPYLSFSYGTRQLKEADTNLETIMHEADVALYQDKQDTKAARKEAWEAGTPAEWRLRTRSGPSTTATRAH